MKDIDGQERPPIDGEDEIHPFDKPPENLGEALSEHMVFRVALEAASKRRTDPQDAKDIARFVEDKVLKRMKKDDRFAADVPGAVMFIRRCVTRRRIDLWKVRTARRAAE